MPEGRLQRTRDAYRDEFKPAKMITRIDQNGDHRLVVPLPPSLVSIDQCTLGWPFLLREGAHGQEG